MDRQLLKKILLDKQDEIENQEVIFRDFQFEDLASYVMVGIRRAGKSYLLYQRIKQLLSSGKKWDEILYINFEDERLDGFSSEDFDSILDVHMELYRKRPILFLDEIQIVDNWHKFARRIADSKYIAYITGSNAKMLSQEIMTTLGGRYIQKVVYPFSFEEFLKTRNVMYDELSLLRKNSRADFMHCLDEYFKNGGLPECVRFGHKRDYLSSVYQKIYLGDIIARNSIDNQQGVRLLIKKMADSVMQPISMNRLQKILSSIGGKISLPTVSKYVDNIVDSWLLIKIANIASSFTERESVCKYYFVDNGILNLFYFDNNTSLLENLVAITLVRNYGYEDQVYFYNKNVAVDFYLPYQEMALQVSYTISNLDTYEREVSALTKICNVLPCRRRILVTYDEERSVADEHGIIEVVPLYKFLLEHPIL